jgi:hypothetical protein
LHLLGFLWPNPGFSKGYGGKNKKIWFGLNSRLRLCVGGPSGLSKGALPGRGPALSVGSSIAQISDFANAA